MDGFAAVILPLKFNCFTNFDEAYFALLFYIDPGYFFNDIAMIPLSPFIGGLYLPLAEV